MGDHDGLESVITIGWNTHTTVRTGDGTADQARHRLAKCCNAILGFGLVHPLDTEKLEGSRSSTSGRPSLTRCMPVAEMRAAASTITSATARASFCCVLLGGKFERARSSSPEAIDHLSGRTPLSQPNLAARKPSRKVSSGALTVPAFNSCVL